MKYWKLTINSTQQSSREAQHYSKWVAVHITLLITFQLNFFNLLYVSKLRIEFTWIRKSPKKEISNALYISVKIPWTRKKKRLNEVCNALSLLYTMQISFIFYLLIIFHHPSPYILLLLHSTKVFIINHQLIKVRKHAIPVNSWVWFTIYVHIAFHLPVISPKPKWWQENTSGHIIIASYTKTQWYLTSNNLALSECLTEGGFPKRQINKINYWWHSRIRMIWSTFISKLIINNLLGNAKILATFFFNLALNNLTY